MTDKRAAHTGASAALLLLFCLGAAGLPAADKIAPELWQEAAGGSRLRVFVVLGDQPQREILQRIEAGSQFRMEKAAGDYRRAAAEPGLSDQVLAEYRDRLDAVVLENRQAAAREIDFRIRPAQELAMARLTALGATRLHRYLVVNMLAAEIPPSALGALEADPAVAGVFPMPEYTASLDVSVPTTGAPALWDRGYTGAGQSVAVLDSGLSTTHPAFSGRQVVSRVFLEYGADHPCFADEASSAEDRNGHGTAVSGVVQAVAKGLGTLYNLKVAFHKREIPGQCQPTASASFGDVMAALDWAAANTPARILNFSYGSRAKTDYPPAAGLLDAIADQYGMTIVVAAGNSGPEGSSLDDTASAYNVIAVAALDDRNTVGDGDDSVSEFSSRGPTLGGRKKPDLSAPGERIRVPQPGNRYGDVDGTSVAAPHVTGAAALLRHKGITSPLLLKAALLNTRGSWDPARGWGPLKLGPAATGGSYFQSTLTPATPGGHATRLYRARARDGALATLVWNRHSLQSGGAPDRLEDLYLWVYSRPNNSLRQDDDVVYRPDTLANVKQADVGGDVVVNVSGTMLTAPESFGLAISDSGFAEASGPALSLQCSAPASVVAGAAFSLTCEATNRGDLEAFDVMAEPRVPAGFAAVAKQSFGTLPVGGRATRSWTITSGAATGRQTIRVALRSVSFGVEYTASAQVVVEVGSALVPLSVTPTSVSFSHKKGGPNPEPIAVSVTNPGAALPFTVSTTSSWLAVSPREGRTPSALRISANPAGLGAGVYNGTITIAAPGAANSPQVVSATLRVEDQGPTVRLKMMTKSVPTESGCPYPTATSTFLPTDAHSILWFLVDGAKAGDRVNDEWYAPDGSLYDTGEWAPLESGGGWCLWNSLPIAGKAAAAKLGAWSVKLFYNGAHLFTLTFEIKEPVKVVGKMLTRDPLADSGCAVPTPATSFGASDPQAWLWFKLAGLEAGERVTAEWRAPDGSVYESYAWEPLDSSGDRCFWLALEIRGKRAALLVGNWSANVNYSGKLVITLPFKISAGFTLDKSLTARTTAALAGCPEPDLVTTFARTDSRVYVWFHVSRASAGDRAAIEFYSPGGQSQATVKWDPLERAGNWCYRGWMNIAGTPAAGMFGDWEARILWNDEVISTLPFQIVPLYVVDHKMAKFVPENFCPTAPEPTSSFATADERMWLWFHLRGTQNGDRAHAEWYRPDGELYRLSRWTVGAAAGSTCFISSTNLAGTTAASHPGEWTISVFFNDEFLFTERFTVVPPPEAGRQALRRAEGFAPETGKRRAQRDRKGRQD